MVIAFAASHGTGKTTTAKALHEKLGHPWVYYEEYYRRIASALGYQAPRCIVKEDLSARIESVR